MAMLDDTGLTAIGPGRWQGEITDRWSVRAPNGGYIATYLTRVLMHESPFPDPLSRNVHYVAPAQPGPAFFDVDVLRAGTLVAQSRQLARLIEEPG